MRTKKNETAAGIHLHEETLQVSAKTITQVDMAFEVRDLQQRIMCTYVKRISRSPANAHVYTQHQIMLLWT